MSKVNEVDTTKKKRSRVRESVRELERRTETTGQRSPSPTVHGNDSRVEVPVALAPGPPKHSVAGKDSNLRKKDKGASPKSPSPEHEDVVIVDGAEENFRMPFASITGGGMPFCSMLRAISL